MLLVYGALIVIFIGGIFWAKHDEEKVTAGDCGYFPENQSDLTALACTDPEAALRVVRDFSSGKCPKTDRTMMASRRIGGRSPETQYMCLVLNAEVGDCFIGFNYHGNLFTTREMRKVPCAEPGAFKVITAEDTFNPRICPRDTAVPATEQRSIAHRDPTKSYCLQLQGH